MQRSGTGYRCQYTPNFKKKRDYSLDQIDLFAAYVIPKDAWYLIPAAVLLGQRRITTTMLSPVVTPKKKASYRYECYREAWNLLTKSRNELAQWKPGRSPQPVLLDLEWDGNQSPGGTTESSPALKRRVRKENLNQSRGRQKIPWREIGRKINSIDGRAAQAFDLDCIINTAGIM